MSQGNGSLPSESKAYSNCSGTGFHSAYTSPKPWLMKVLNQNSDVRSSFTIKAWHSGYLDYRPDSMTSFCWNYEVSCFIPVNLSVKQIQSAHVKASHMKGGMSPCTLCLALCMCANVMQVLLSFTNTSSHSSLSSLISQPYLLRSFSLCKIFQMLSF